MRQAAILTLKGLYNSEVVTVAKQSNYKTTRLTNEISTLRNDFGIDIITDMIRSKYQYHKPYGSYRLNRSKENLEKVRKILAKYSNPKNLKSAKNELSVKGG